MVLDLSESPVSGTLEVRRDGEAIVVGRSGGGIVALFGP
jgi:hypothetical protein